MRTFKEQLSNDIKQVFINTNEFAEMHFLNDVEIACILDKNTIETRKYNRVSSFSDGLYECDAILIYSKADYFKELVSGEICYVDDINYKVKNYSCDDGVVTLSLAMG